MAATLQADHMLQQLNATISAVTHSLPRVKQQAKGEQREKY